MSYILDALRRADAERERGSIPGIHAQPVPLASPDGQAQPPARPWAWTVAGIALALLAAALAWRLLSAEDNAQPIAAAPAVVSPPAPPPSPVAPAPRPVAPQPALPAPVLAHAPLAPPRAAAPADARVYAQHELPDEIRHQLPTLTVGGSMYSDDPAHRMLIINGQIYHEHDQLAPQLTLEQIKLKAAVLKYKSYRYVISF
jgi:general secretion pathway protein B